MGQRIADMSDWAERRQRENRIGIYLHIPFCIRKCGYCDFLSFPVEGAFSSPSCRYGQREIERYVKALCQEIQAEPPAWTGIPRIRKQQAIVLTVFFGGGTPSLLTGEQIGRILCQLRQEYPIAEEAEITMEANPGTLTAESLAAYRKAGINRLSIGLQSADNQELKRLGRIHTWEEFLKNFYEARRVGFDNINIDLMSALPGQTLASWEETLKKVLALEPEHLSAYSLILEEGTPFYERYGGQEEQERQEGQEKQEGQEGGEALPDEETERRMYEVTEELLKQAGLYRYEISNYARPGYECRHNNAYWQRIPYMGYGLGASSFWEEVRWRNETDLVKYVRLWETGSWREPESVAWQEIEPLSRSDQMAETMFLGLRRTEGIQEEAFYQHFGQSLEEVYGAVLAKQERLGLLERRDGRVRLTRFGVDVSNQVFWEYL